MDINDRNANFSRFIDLKIWKNAMEQLAKIIDHPIITIDSEGNEVLVINEMPYYCKLINSTKKGKGRCIWQYKDIIRKISIDNISTIHSKCYAGLSYIWSPIVINNTLIGAVGCSSLCNNSDVKVNFEEISNKTEIETDELIESYDIIKKITDDEIVRLQVTVQIASSVLASIISQQTASNGNIKQLTTLHSITEMVNSTLDIDKIIQSIISVMIEHSKAENCSVLVFKNNSIAKGYYHNKAENLYQIENVISNEILHCKSVNRMSGLKKDFRFSGKIPTTNINSIILFPLKHKGDILGVINLFYAELSLENIDDNILDFLKKITDEAAIAIFNAEEFYETKEESMHDKLTELYNRRYFLDMLKKEIEKSEGSKEPLTIAMIDIDDFKHYNDKHGHQKGDYLIRGLSDLLRNGVRKDDIVGRYGGEEFIIIFPNTSNENAINIMERIRKSIENYCFDGRESQPGCKITISAGIISCVYKKLQIHEIINLADEALYKAKKEGKNRIVSKIMIDKGLPVLDITDVDDYYKSLR